MKLILINGLGGAGKSSSGKALMRAMDSSAYIGLDSLVATNPWEFNKKTDDLGIKNAISLIRNFSETGFENIIISGLTRNQEILNDFLSSLNQKADILFIWLYADADQRILRKEKRNRDQADKREDFNSLDVLIPNIKSIEIKEGKSVFIDTSHKSVEQVVQEILSYTK
ncbi:MAG: hypothetical protein A3D44_02825 [Candidatus Staskawiczbacteria bacterium RIFCSPHIGHO2_02_FULL_42_22]|uniref:UDP-N-acetylglucosamine kinase n=1 Tax=Candidatus Staskawiczbacteria bacterium RIFCSPHIGHO2_02_FULL_42_22 TaxID=1802207 RepID=A0A1G2I3N8_9BACT|nr:MAG: hypothetical protein A3D44_02825 [Candidatus Staskawiczbacteria bacterium RIFCSPHIGHO2_02_FULL_42_22]